MVPNTYTRRLNTKRRYWGHLFGGRYKVIPVEDEATSPRGSIVWRDYMREGNKRAARLDR